jgi:hypothetical protein
MVAAERVPMQVTTDTFMAIELAYFLANIG